MTTQTLDQMLENIPGDLLTAFNEAQRETIQTSAQITIERRTNPSLRRKGFYTANFTAYQNKDGKQIMYFGDDSEHQNPIFNNIDEATSQLQATNNYRCNETDIASIVSSVHSGATVEIDMSLLGLQEYDHEFSYLEINTKTYQVIISDKETRDMNDTEKALVQKVYGVNFNENLNMLSDASISTKRIYVSNPKYIEANAKDGEMLAQACFLLSFDSNSSFDANGRRVVDTAGLRGVRRNDVTEDSTYVKAVQRVALQ